MFGDWRNFVIAGLGALLLLAQWYYPGKIEDLRGQLDALEIAARQAEIEAQDRQREAEIAYQKQADEAAAGARAELAGVEAEYQAALRDLRARVDGGVSNSAADSDSAAAVPGVTGAPGGIGGPCKCGGGGIDAAKFRGLLERQLVIAKDCDITAQKYNELLKLYQGIAEYQSKYTY